MNIPTPSNPQTSERQSPKGKKVPQSKQVEVLLDQLNKAGSLNATQARDLASMTARANKAEDTLRALVRLVNITR